MVMYFDAFEIGQEFTTPARTITEADVAAFSSWTCDVNPIHTDAAFASQSRFGQRLAHGLLGISHCMGLMSRINIFEGSAVAMLGIDNWRFLKPLFINDTIHVRIRITEKRLTSNGKHGLIGRHFDLINQNGEIVQAGESSVMVALGPEPVK